ncbi:MAG: LysM peptidoglycan-binding domain-containing protein, partial [Prolixibacteraceae bacterium]|nr:LysM peptidoglycan-binding domain-containing protein [Prolixibacteraceae bacterium]
LIQYNPALVQGLKAGDYIRIPYKKGITLNNNVDQEQQKPSEFIIHKIQRRETPYFVAKKYGIQIEDIYKYNPDLKKFKKGLEIKIPVFKSEVVTETILKSEPVPDVIEPEISGDFIEYKVAPGDNPYSISKKYNRSLQEFYKFNPEYKNAKIPIGTVVKFPRETAMPNTEIKREGEYFYHLIETGETLYGLTKKYNISERELKDLNPVLENGFPAGVELKIPVSYLPELSVIPVNDDAFMRHQVVAGETLTRLSVNYNVGIAEIKKANPVLQKRDGLLEGEIILIPKIPEPVVIENTDIRPDNINPDKLQENILPEPDDSFYEVETIVEVPEGCKPSETGPYFYEKFRIALMLPLFLEANDTLNNKPVRIDTLLAETTDDMIIEVDTIETEYSDENKVWNFYNRGNLNTEEILHFYEGVLLAVDSMRNKGMNIELSVYDTRLERHVVDSLITTDEFLAFDLIIGPVSGSLQKTVADFAAKNRIPIVSPLSVDGSITQNNPYYFQVFPTREYMLKKTAEYIADEYFNSNFIVLQIGNPDPDNKLFVEMCSEKLFNSGYYSDVNNVSFRYYDFNKYGGQGISRILSKTRENVFIIPSFDEGEVSVAVSNINNNAADYDITVIGNYRYKQFESIDQEHFHNVKLKYYYPYWVDYSSPVVTKIVSEFRNYFKTDPNQYSMQGFDVAFYFLNAFWSYGKNFESCLPYMDCQLTQGNYKFEKVSQFGGFMNHGLSLISYERDYTVRKKETAGKIIYVYK